MKKLISIVLGAVLLMFFAAQANAQKSLGLSVNSYKITSIRPLSWRSVDGAVDLSLNSATSFRLSGISGVVYKNGRPFVQGKADDLAVKKGSSSLTVRGNATLCNGVGLLDVLRCINFNPSDYSVDVYLTLTLEDGTSVPIVKKGVPLSSILSR